MPLIVYRNEIARIFKAKTKGWKRNESEDEHKDLTSMEDNHVGFNFSVEK